MKHKLSHPILAFVVLVLAGLSAAILPATAETAPGSNEKKSQAQDTEIIAYYFHGNFRCATCRKLEAYSKEAITKGFAGELETGQLIWKTVNTDEKENKHFNEDFQLVTKSVVLVEYRNGEVTRFENLKLVWQLVGDEDGFIRYVRNQTRTFLEAVE